MMRDHEHRFLGQMQTTKFHCSGGHGPCFARSHHVRQQWTAALEDAPNRVLLMRGEISIAERRPDHARQGQVRTVEIAEPEVVEAEVVLLGEAFRAFLVFPNPIPKAIYQLLLLLPRSDGLWLIYCASSILVLVVGCRGAPIQRLLYQIGRAKAGGAVGRGVIHNVLRAVVELDYPGRDGLSVPDSHAGARYI